MTTDWLADKRFEAAADRILDAAGVLFARDDAATIGMNEIAKAAGCSRATIYRYFDNRDALHEAYVHRETHRVFLTLVDGIAGFTDPNERLMEGVLAALRSVRENPSLSSWFASTQRPIGGEMAERSEVIQALTEGFLRTLDAGGDTEVAGDVEMRARWLVRVMISLLLFPGRNTADERTMLEDFVLPTVLPLRVAPYTAG